jgi:hypothetical protein
MYPFSSPGGLGAATWVAARPYREPRRWPVRVQRFPLRLSPGFFSVEPTGEWRLSMPFSYSASTTRDPIGARISGGRGVNNLPWVFSERLGKGRGTSSKGEQEKVTPFPCQKKANLPLLTSKSRTPAPAPLCSSDRFHVDSVSGDEDEAAGEDYDGLSITGRSSPGGGSAQVTREGTGGACPGWGTRTFSPAFSGKERIYSTCPIKGR